LEWSDIDDDESGIRKIEIGIGSSNGSADIVQFERLLTSNIPTVGGVLSYITGVE
jgi:hypothetical protein